MTVEHTPRVFPRSLPGMESSTANLARRVSPKDSSSEKAIVESRGQTDSIEKLQADEDKGDDRLNDNWVLAKYG